MPKKTWREFATYAFYRQPYKGDVLHGQYSGNERRWPQPQPSSSMVLQPFVGPWSLLQFRNHFKTDGRTPWTGDQPVARQLPKHRPKQTQNKSIQTSMPSVGFEPTIPAFERESTLHGLDRAVTAIGGGEYQILQKNDCRSFSNWKNDHTSPCNKLILISHTIANYQQVNLRVNNTNGNLRPETVPPPPSVSTGT
jgi:hypothetical protein